MKKKTVIISAILLTVIIAAGILLIPRIQVKRLADEFIMPLFELENENGGYFEKYDIKESSGMKIENEIYSLYLPDNFRLENSSESVYINDDREYIEIMTSAAERPASLSDIDLRSHYGVIVPNIADLSGGYEQIGKGDMNTDYGIIKSMALLERSDYSFWNIEKALAFCRLASLKWIYCSGCEVYVYERSDITGIIYVRPAELSETQEQVYSVQFDFYSAADPNTPYTLSFAVRSPEKAYAVINSIEMK